MEALGRCRAATPAIDVMFLEQQDADPFSETPELTTQAKQVATRIARFVGGAESIASGESACS